MTGSSPSAPSGCRCSTSPAPRHSVRHGGRRPRRVHPAARDRSRCWNGLSRNSCRRIPSSSTCARARARSRSRCRSIGPTPASSPSTTPMMRSPTPDATPQERPSNSSRPTSPRRVCSLNSTARWISSSPIRPTFRMARTWNPKWPNMIRRTRCSAGRMEWPSSIALSNSPHACCVTGEPVRSNTTTPHRPAPSRRSPAQDDSWTSPPGATSATRARPRLLSRRA